MPTVLIVEDGDDVTPLEIALSSLDDVVIRTVGDGQDALDLLRSASVHIAAIVTDLHLPRVDGFELITAIRADGRYARVPIVVVSGDSHPDLPERLLNLGVAAFFLKPYSPAEIRHTLEKLLHEQ